METPPSKILNSILCKKFPNKSRDPLNSKSIMSIRTRNSVSKFPQTPLFMLQLLNPTPNALSDSLPLKCLSQSSELPKIARMLKWTPTLRAWWTRWDLARTNQGYTPLMPTNPKETKWKVTEPSLSSSWNRMFRLELSKSQLHVKVIENNSKC